MVEQCDRCQEELDIGQIGLCDSCQEHDSHTHDEEDDPEAQTP